MSDKLGAGVSWFICESGHVHLTFTDHDGNDLIAISIDIEDWCDLADEIDEEIEITLAQEEARTAVKH